MCLPPGFRSSPLHSITHFCTGLLSATSCKLALDQSRAPVLQGFSGVASKGSKEGAEVGLQQARALAVQAGAGRQAGAAPAARTGCDGVQWMGPGWAVMVRNGWALDGLE